MVSACRRNADYALPGADANPSRECPETNRGTHVGAVQYGTALADVYEREHFPLDALIGREGQAGPYMRIMYIMLNYG